MQFFFKKKIFITFIKKIKMSSDTISINKLPVVEEFYSVQGEGMNVGTAAYFVRLAGCDVNCPWCDSKETWAVNKTQYVDIEDITNRAMKSESCNVDITGGEPLMYNLDNLCESLEKQCLSIWLETSGAHPLSGNFDWITVSPKKNKPPLDEVLEQASELKMIISNENDFLDAETYSKKVPAECALLLQANWENFETANALIFNYVLKHPIWKISLQTHKILKIK